MCSIKVSEGHHRSSDLLPAWLWRVLAVLVVIRCCAAVVLGHYVGAGGLVLLRWLAPRSFR
jgi:hypothetical protein